MTRGTLAILSALFVLHAIVAEPAWADEEYSPSRSQQPPTRNARPAYRTARDPRPQARYAPQGRIASTQMDGRGQMEEVDTPPARPRYQGDTTSNMSYDASSPYEQFDDSLYQDGGPYDDGGGFCGPRCRGPIYVRGEYLLWWVKGDNTPALVTTSPDATPRAQAGVLGQPNTSILFGGDQLNGSGRSGARVVAGWWLEPGARVEGDWFGLGQQNATFDALSAGSPILARPFFNLGTGAQDSNIVAYPSQLQGSISVSETSSFWGAGLHATRNVICVDTCDDRHFRVDFLYGLRYLRLRENLTINDSITSNSTVAAATSLASSDSFATSNNFLGANLGVMSESRLCRWSFTSIGRLGLGGTAEHVNINGSTTTTTGGQTTTSAGGLLAMPTNIGSYNHTGFTVVPHLELKLAYELGANVRLTFGYDVMYWSRVARPGEQIDTFVNTSQASGGTLRGTPGPLFTFRESDLWIQGISAGAEWRF